MERLSSNIATKIAEELKLSEDQKEVIAYGTFALIQTIVSIIIFIIFGSIFNVLVEVLIISFTTSILRKYSGGIHASSPGICTTIGTVICIAQGWLVKFVLGPWLDYKFSIIIGIIIFSWSYYMIYRLAPVDSPAKPIKTEKKRQRMKKRCYFLLGIYLVITAINMFLFYITMNINYIIYSSGIYVGIVWQVFTLTKLGYLTLGIVDTFLYKVLNNIRGGKTL
jgi:accessory gene regulator B